MDKCHIAISVVSEIKHPVEAGHKINIKTWLDMGEEGWLHVSFLFHNISAALDNSTVPIFKVDLSCILPNKLYNFF